MGKNKKSKFNDDLAKDIFDELIEDAMPGGQSSDSHLHEASAIDIEADSEDSDFEFADVSQTRPQDDFSDKTAMVDEDDEGTMPLGLNENSGSAEKSLPKEFDSAPAKPMPKKPQQRAAVGRADVLRSSGMSGPTEVALAQSENLRLAQDRILDLEKEIERLRVENEELGSAGETLRRRADELLSGTEELERKLEHEISTSNQEKEILRSSRDLLRKEVEEIKQKNSELELRLSTNIQRVRVRERELENRLELVKIEGKALIKSKDEMILDLKRQIDQLNLELNNYRVKSQDLNKQIADRQETLRRTVKALRLALSMMEGEEQIPLKKAK